MRKFLLLLIIFIKLTSHINAQESVLSGHVLDSKTGEPLSFASIKINNLNAAKVDSSGYFKLKVEAGKYKLTISKVGYVTIFQTVHIGFEESLNQKFYLDPFTNELNSVVVSGSKQEKPLANETVSIISVKPNLIANSNSTNLSDILNKVPGVTVIEGQAIIRGAVGWSYNVGSRVMVMLDDMPLMGADLGDVQWDLLPIEAAEKIEVLKGPSSVLYGSSASSGTVTLQTGWPTNKPETKIQTYQGITGNPRTTDAIWWERTSQPFNSGTFFSHKQKFGQFDLVTSGNVDMVRSYIQQNDSYRARMYFKTRYRFKNIKGLSTGISGNLMVKKAGRYFLWQNSDSGLYKPWAGSTGQDFYRIWSLNPFITYSKPNNYLITLHLQQYNITRFVDTTQYTNNLNNAVANGQAMDINFQKNIFKGLSINTGIYLSRIWAVGNIYSGEHSGYSAAAFAQADYHYKKLTVNAGLRYEFNALGVIEETTRPLIRGGINYQTGKKTFLRATYGEGYRFPSIVERYVDDQLNSVRIYPNPDLKSERGWYTELGVRQGFSIGNNFNASFDAAFFWQEYKNLIEWTYAQWTKPYLDTTVMPPVIHQELPGFKFINLEHTRTAGLDFTLEGDGVINEIGVRTLCGYTYIYPVDLAIDPSLQNFGNYMSNFFSTYTNLTAAEKESILKYRNRKLLKSDIELNYKKFAFGYSANYYSTFDQIDPRLSDIVQPFLDRSGVGVWVQNVRLSYQIDQHVTIAFLVNNIDNVEYTIRPGRVDPPRNFNVQFRMAF